MSKIWIVGIKTSQRTDEAEKIQHIISKYGCIVRTRMGFHIPDHPDGDTGIILLELFGDKEEFKKLVKELEKLETVDVQVMKFKNKKKKEALIDNKEKRQ